MPVRKIRHLYLVPPPVPERCDECGEFTEECECSPLPDADQRIGGNDNPYTGDIA